MSDTTPLGEIFNPTASADASSDNSSTKDESTESTESTEKVEPESSADEKKVVEGDTQDASDDQKGEKKDPPVTEKKKADAGDDKSKDSSKSADEKTQKQEDPFEKRWKDTVTWAQREQTARVQLEDKHQALIKEVATLKKQIADPNYDPATDPENQGPSSEQIATTSVEVGKTLASREAAYDKHGKEKVDTVLTEFHQLFGKNPAVQQAVRESNSPVQKAMEIHEDFQFRSKYGFKPDEVLANIKKEVLEAEGKRLKAEILEEIRAGGEKKSKTVSGLSTVRGGNGMDKGQSNTTPQTALKTLFPL
jgi:hypothetical protein